MFKKFPLISNNLDATIKYVLSFIAFCLLTIAIITQLLAHRYNMALFNLSALITWNLIYIFLKHKDYVNPLRSYKSLLLTIGIFTTIGIVLWGTSYPTLTTLFIVVLLLLIDNTKKQLIYIYGLGFILIYSIRILYEIITKQLKFDSILDNFLELLLLTIITQQIARLNYKLHKKYRLQRIDMDSSRITFPPLLAHLINNILNSRSKIKNKNVNYKLLWNILLLVTALNQQETLKILPKINRIIKDLTPYISTGNTLITRCKYITPPSCNINKINLFFMAVFEALINALKYGNNVDVYIQLRENSCIARIKNSVSLNKTLALIQKEQVKNTLQNINAYIKEFATYNQLFDLKQQQILNKIIVSIRFE